MFVKIVIVLLLLIVAASLLVQRPGTPGTPRRRVATNLRPLMTRIAIVLLVVVGIAAALHLAGCAPPPKHFHAQDISGADYARLDGLDGFMDHRGSRLASADFRGKAVVVFFGYTQCPDICPTTLTGMQAAIRRLAPENAARVQVLFVTVDPERDTQDVLAGYVPWFDPRFLGVRADADTTRRVATAFKVYFAKVRSDGALGYSIDHTAESYAYDPQGRLRLKIAHGANPEQIAEDLSKLLAGQ